MTKHIIICKELFFLNVKNIQKYTIRIDHNEIAYYKVKKYLAF